MKILLVEDDLHSAAILLQLLAESHYTIDAVADAKMAWQYVETYDYDLIILDVMLPDSDGIGLCAKLRNEGYTIPVLLLTAKDSTSDRVMGLEAGADDYVVKPYNFQELVARIRALLRRYHEGDTLIQEFMWEGLRLDLRTNTVTYKQQPLRLTQKEYGLLEIFLRHPQQIFSRSALIDQVWSAGEFPSDEAVTTHIKGLRQKLKVAGLPSDPIETLYGLGYRLKALPVSVQLTSKPLAIAPFPEETVVAENISPLDKARLQEVIAIMSKKLIASLPEQIAMFRQIAIALEQDKLGADLRYEGYIQAHRLIGSLGSLGFPKGSAIARQIEEMLHSDFPLISSNADLLGQLIAELEKITLKPSVTMVSGLSDRVMAVGKGDRGKVMIVDDDPNILEILRRSLENLDIEVITLQNPLQFWQVLESTAPDLLILDLIMPECSGLDLCRAVRTSSLWHDLKIVFLSAHSDRETIRQLFIAGADDYLSKPVTESDLYTRILSRLERIRLSHKPQRS
ncbi:MAG: protein RcaC [Pseudanabaena sp.]|nr:MAG: protein RcaC [Pseudanabaena sp.]